MTCQEAILSEQTYDYITDFSVTEMQGIDGLQCELTVNEPYHILYVDNGYLPSLENNALDYQGIPKLYGLTQIGGDENVTLSDDQGRRDNPSAGRQAYNVRERQAEPFDPVSLIASGISQVQGPPLNLTGYGTLICIIDTGIDYLNPLFRDELGNTRIEAIWDQTVQTGNRPEGFPYGSEYTREQINLALRSDEPREIVPSVDEVGHGTALASVAAGSPGGLTGTGNLSGSTTVPGENPGGLTGTGNLAGSATVPGENPAGLTGAGNLAGSTTVPGENSSGLTGAGNLAGSTTVPGENPAGLTGIGSPAVRPSVRPTVPAGFQSAAPEAGLVIVKCKPAKAYLMDYYLLPSQALAYQENDVMLAVKYCERFAKLFERPVVICLGIGTSIGNHNGTSPLSRYLNQVAVKRNRVVVVSGGNEGNSAGHYRGNSPVEEVEIRVAEGNAGFYMELWGRRTNVINVEIRSPGGESIPPIPLGLRQSITFSFVYEKTRVTIYSALVEPSSGDELISFRFVDPTPGIWIIRVISREDAQDGTFDLWLPLIQFQHSPVYFLSPYPDVTMTEPAMASEVISVSAYQPANASFYIESGRGFTRDGLPKPDLSAPGASVSTAYGKQNGTGFAAALTAGAAAQLLQWSVVEGNAILADSRTVKSYLVRGAKRSSDLSYPNKEWGYGRLDVSGTFASLRG